ncbi:methionyl-tRNA formyltransferase [Commensalibacter papalotli (ex Servin-Garciduenas et al. 2014)]|uniref:Methionyl-tRNA formyltransferase n=1 Tax=Commensalibacter papalotli (ex Servin-Garciduenas et al. 2014) TaxID=1208583 RepID=W7DV96_9PROT|nr:methionyl-tRNA formyltransferase [Commensalibacter papalotli (ex Servin-Garciduenas et al. 2014)]EUK18955.1 methionyl-tRNA formyltransferase [Commensalibacter papalotli (ex Servin-Garciduenas et al. 2014)]
MRIAFMGTPDFAVPALQALHQAGHEIVAVYCQPARPAGRGRKIRPCAVQQAAEQLNISVYSPTILKNQPEEFERFASFDLDIAIVAAYGLILPSEMLNIPRLGCLNIHASLLPRWRGASPIQSSIWAGDTQTGVSIMKMDVGLDTGDVYKEEILPITHQTTAQSLHDDLSQLGGKLILQTLNALADNPSLSPHPQSEEGVIYARQLNKQDGKINWALTAKEIDQQIRALTPWPGTFTLLDGNLLKITKAAISTEKNTNTPGSTLVSSNALLVTCGDHHTIELLEVQLAGKKAMSVQDFLRGNSINSKAILG